MQLAPTLISCVLFAMVRVISCITFACYRFFGLGFRGPTLMPGGCNSFQDNPDCKSMNEGNLSPVCRQLGGLQRSDINKINRYERALEGCHSIDGSSSHCRGLNLVPLSFYSLSLVTFEDQRYTTIDLQINYLRECESVRIYTINP